jgi:hypothetical protein
MIVFIMLGSSRGVAAQGIQRFALPTAPEPRLVTSFPSQDFTMSVTLSVAAKYHSESFPEKYGFLVTENHPTQNFATLLSFQETKTSFMTEVRMPVAQVYGSRLHVGLFIQTLQNGNLTLGPLAASLALHSLSQPRSVNLYGVGLSIPLGKQAHTDPSNNLFWRSLRGFIHDR